MVLFRGSGFLLGFRSLFITEIIYVLRVWWEDLKGVERDFDSRGFGGFI